MSTDTDRVSHTKPAMTQERWITATEWPMAVVGVVFITAYAVEVLDEPVGVYSRLLELTIWLSWAAFVVDYVIRLILSDNRSRWFVRHLPELLIVALPILRPLRLLRLLAVLAVLHRVTGRAIRGRVLMFTVVTVLVLIFVASLAILDTERDRADATIRTFGDALWWSITTITTIGYGDYSPTTMTGRFIAVGLMIGGISLIGVVTATIATWIVERVSEDDEANMVATRKQINALHAEIRELRADLARGPDAGSATDGSAASVADGPAT
ncbi:potassium channel family protein [Williamsia soli]|uniref:potassium channel family protein n=1 Tax=Williamsia soli TaxID=364929 RepID=UPI001F234B63|nr:potassium channel family protein [Williamsia soli]